MLQVHICLRLVAQIYSKHAVNSAQCNKERLQESCKRGNHTAANVFAHLSSSSAPKVAAQQTDVVAQELGKQNPELLQMINSNQEEFLRMINEPAPQGGGDMADLAAQLAGAAGAGGTPASLLSQQSHLPTSTSGPNLT